MSNDDLEAVETLINRRHRYINAIMEAKAVAAKKKAPIDQPTAAALQREAHAIRNAMEALAPRLSDEQAIQKLKAAIGRMHTTMAYPLR